MEQLKQIEIMADIEIYVEEYERNTGEKWVWNQQKVKQAMKYLYKSITLLGLQQKHYNLGTDEYK